MGNSQELTEDKGNRGGSAMLGAFKHVLDLVIGHVLSAPLLSVAAGMGAWVWSNVSAVMLGAAATLAACGMLRLARGTVIPDRRSRWLTIAAATLSISSVLHSAILPIAQMRVGDQVVLPQRTYADMLDILASPNDRDPRRLRNLLTRLQRDLVEVLRHHASVTVEVTLFDRDRGALRAPDENFIVGLPMSFLKREFPIPSGGRSSIAGYVYVRNEAVVVGDGPADTRFLEFKDETEKFLGGVHSIASVPIPNGSQSDAAIGAISITALPKNEFDWSDVVYLRSYAEVLGRYLLRGEGRWMHAEMRRTVSGQTECVQESDSTIRTGS